MIKWNYHQYFDKLIPFLNYYNLCKISTVMPLEIYTSFGRLQLDLVAYAYLVGEHFWLYLDANNRIKYASWQFFSNTAIPPEPVPMVSVTSLGEYLSHTQYWFLVNNNNSLIDLLAQYPILLGALFVRISTSEISLIKPSLIDQSSKVASQQFVFPTHVDMARMSYPMAQPRSNMPYRSPPVMSTPIAEAPVVPTSVAGASVISTSVPYRSPPPIPAIHTMAPKSAIHTMAPKPSVVATLNGPKSSVVAPRHVKTIASTLSEPTLIERFNEKRAINEIC